MIPFTFDGLPWDALLGLAVLIWLGERWFPHPGARFGLSSHFPADPPSVSRAAQPAVPPEAEPSALWDRELDG